MIIQEVVAKKADWSTLFTAAGMEFIMILATSQHNARREKRTERPCLMI